MLLPAQVLGRKVAPIPNWSKVVRSITLFTTVYSTRDYSIINWSKGLFNYIPISLYIPNNPNWSKVAPIGVRLLHIAPKHKYQSTDSGYRLRLVVISPY